MGAGDTLSYVGDAGDPAAREIAPYLVVALECQRPLVLPERIGLAGARALTIGRGAERARTGDDAIELTLADGWMSSAHARLTRTGSAWTVEDLSSKNGTWVNGVRADRTRLADGDLIEAGSTIFLFRDPPTDRFGDRADLSADELATLPLAMRTLSPAVARRLSAIDRVAASKVPVILLGETGTGKEVAARALHEQSGRSGELVAVNCGALPRELIESELFGHRRGSFSGADVDRDGLVRSADGGTLLLDEIAELPEPSQVALLRVLQEGEVRPVGGSSAIAVDVRVVAATHRDLARLVADGLFREDLYARLAGLTVELEPLRRRREDIGLLVAELLPKVAPPGADVALSREAGRALFAYRWPRNIRELEQALAAAVALSGGETIELDHLPEAVRAGAPAADQPILSDDDRELRDQLVDHLDREAGNVRAVARALDKAPMQIYRWCKRLGIDIDRYRR